MLEAHNVPELSAGVNCTFEDLAEMTGLVEGNRIKCFSPAEKDMPRIIVEKSKGGTIVIYISHEATNTGDQEIYDSIYDSGGFHTAGMRCDACIMTTDTLYMTSITC